jgi:hypothetical protein
MSRDFDEFLDEFFKKGMEEEDKRYFEEISKDVVMLENAKMNDRVKFGKIIWKVIAVEKEKKLLISNDCIGMDYEWEANQEKASHKEIEWKDLVNMNNDIPINYKEEFEKIKKYLNEWFCDKTFSMEELECIVPRVSKTRSESAGMEVQSDKIFLLSESEVKKYIPEKKDRIASMHVMFNDVARAWTLRLENETDTQTVVNSEGEIETLPNGYINEWFRPAVWVK